MPKDSFHLTKIVVCGSLGFLLHLTMAMAQTRSGWPGPMPSAVKFPNNNLDTIVPLSGAGRTVTLVSSCERYAPVLILLLTLISHHLALGFRTRGAWVGTWDYQLRINGNVIRD